MNKKMNESILVSHFVTSIVDLNFELKTLVVEFYELYGKSSLGFGLAN